MPKVSERRKKRREKKNKSTSKKRPFLGFFLFLIIALVGFFLFKTGPKYWNGEDKVSVVVQNSDGVSVLLFDPQVGEETEFIIPKTTEIEVSKNLGTMPIENVQKRGLDEGMGFDLLPMTVTKSLMFPTSLFSDQKPSEFSFITTKNSNIPFFDRLAIFVFSKRTSNLDEGTIDLGKSLFLTKTKLIDGQLGYKVPSEMSQRLTFYFSDYEFTKEETRIFIKDETGKFGVAERLGKILEILGGKVVTIEKLGSQDGGCLVDSSNKALVRKMERLFGCKKGDGSSEFELQVTLGSQFAL